MSSLKAFISAAILSVGFALTASALPMVDVTSDKVPANMTNVTGNVPAVATTITFVTPSRHVIVKTDPAAAVLYVNYTGVAATTTAGMRIDPGAAIGVDGPAIPSISILGAAATGTYSVLAW